MEAQKQFITNAGHELKTPLTAISTSADVLAMEHDGDEWVHNIQVQSGRLSKLITSLVALSRLDEENPFPVRTEFSLSDALWEISEPFGSLAQAKGKAYTQDIADGLTVTGDRTAIQQMFSILLDNALKYSPDGGSISLTTQRSGKGQRSPCPTPWTRHSPSTPPACLTGSTGRTSPIPAPSAARESAFPLSRPRWRPTAGQSRSGKRAAS